MNKNQNILFNMNFNSDFKFDLQFGQLGEQLFYNLITNKKIEVKRDKWIGITGNIAIEYESRNKPSGIATSEADYWCFIFSGNLEDKIFLIIEINKLKEIARKYYKLGQIKLMGDNDTSKAILIPLKEILNNDSQRTN